MERSFALTTDADDVLVAQLVHTWWKVTPGVDKEVVDDSMPPRFRGRYRIERGRDVTVVEVEIAVSRAESGTQLAFWASAVPSGETEDDLLRSAAEWFVLELEGKGSFVEGMQDG